MKDEEICERLVELGKAAGATDVVATMSTGSQGMVRFSNNEITVVNTLRHRSGSLFVKVGGSKASTNLVETSEASMTTAARKVVAIARSTPPSDVHAPLPVGPFSYDPNLLRSPHVSLEPDDLTSWTEESISAAHKEGADRVAGSLIAHDGTYTIATSGDVLATTEGGSLELSVRAFRGTASGASVALATTNKDLDAQGTGAEAGRYARMAGEPAPGLAGEMDAILSPMVMASLINQVGRMASAFYLDTGMSFLAGKAGLELAAPGFSLYDDPTMAGTFGSTPFDAEGLPTRRNTIFEDGVFKNYLHNTTTAKRYNAQSTANAGLIAPRPFNLVAAPGTRDLEEMVRSVDKGILVTNNWYLRYQNYGTGDFSTIPRDAMFMIDHGELSGSIKELRISDNVLRLFQNMRMVSRDRKWVRWWEVTTPALSPAALIGNVKFTRSSQ